MSRKGHEFELVRESGDNRRPSKKPLTEIPKRKRPQPKPKTGTSDKGGKK